MPSATVSSDFLVRLVRVLESSLPMYLAASGIQTYPAADEIRTAIMQLVDAQRRIAGQAVTVLDEREITPPRGFYPLAYTALHDIDLRHLLPRLATDLQRQAEACEGIAAAAEGTDAAAATLAAEAAAVSRRHQDVLERLSRPQVVASAS